MGIVGSHDTLVYTYGKIAPHDFFYNILASLMLLTELQTSPPLPSPQLSSPTSAKPVLQFELDSSKGLLWGLRGGFRW